MYLKSLHIENFRCFSDYTIEFAPGVTVLFGKNGAGKTTLINAIHKALSFAFDKKIIKQNKYSLSAGFKDLRVEDYAKSDQITDPKTGLYMPFMSIDAVGSFNEEELSWGMCRYSSASSYTPSSSDYKEAYMSLMKEIDRSNILPFFAFYSDAFPHISSPKIPKEEEMNVRNVGYWEWNEETACSKIWITRLERVWKQWDRADRAVKAGENSLAVSDKLLKDGITTQQEYDEDIKLHTNYINSSSVTREKFDKEVSAIRDCLRRFFKGDKNYEIIDVFTSVDELEELCLLTTQGNNPAFSSLPAGYKRLVYMVLDIAYRSFFLNSNTDPFGVVLIDEIDLHLHPELEQVVLQRFMKTFPHVQFIVSTHSPLVLTDIDTKNEKNMVLQMKPGEESPTVLHNVHGIDYNLMLEENMGVSKRKPEIQQLFDEAWQKVADKDAKSAKTIIEKIESVTPGDQTELVRLRSVINRLEIIGR